MAERIVVAKAIRTDDGTTDITQDGALRAGWTETPNETEMQSDGATGLQNLRDVGADVTGFIEVDDEHPIARASNPIVLGIIYQLEIDWEDDAGTLKTTTIGQIGTLIAIATHGVIFVRATRTMTVGAQTGPAPFWRLEWRAVWNPNGDRDMVSTSP